MDHVSPLPGHRARSLPGAPVADAVFAEVVDRVGVLLERGIRPCLATVLVGDDDASTG